MPKNDRPRPALTSAKNAVHAPDGLVDDIIQRLTGAVDAKAIYVFGSRARGDNRADSDIDLLVLCPSAVGESRPGVAARAGASLFGLGFSKDLVVEDPLTFERASKIPGTGEFEVAREGILVYEG